jgi:type IX secretion system PorP/SprF family membrane protein
MKTINKMKNQILLLSFVITALTSFGQQLSNSNLYLENRTLINQAYSGVETGQELSLNYRNQWAGVNNAPITTALNFRGSINRPNFEAGRNAPTTARTSNSGLVSPTGFWAYNGMMVYDNAGLFNRMQFSVSGAYHLPITRKLMLSFAPTLTYSNLKVNTDKMELIRPGDPAYTQYLETGGASNYLGFDAAMVLYSRRFSIGFTAEQLAWLTLANNELDEDIQQHFFVTTDYKFRVSNDWELRPTVNAKLGKNIPSTFDIYARADYRDMFWFGAGYRTSKMWIAMIGVHFKDAIRFGYSYDTGVIDVSNITKGSHEIYLSYTFK